MALVMTKMGTPSNKPHTPHNQPHQQRNQVGSVRGEARSQKVGNIAKRFGLFVLVVFVGISLTFFITHLTPIDPVEQMIASPVVVQVLEGEGAILKNREIMGATNPENAEPGTIRKELAESIEANSVHGSDSPENAKIEIEFFFKPEEIVD